MQGKAVFGQISCNVTKDELVISQKMVFYKNYTILYKYFTIWFCIFCDKNFDVL